MSFTSNAMKVESAIVQQQRSSLAGKYALKHDKTVCMICKNLRYIFSLILCAIFSVIKGVFWPVKHWMLIIFRKLEKRLDQGKNEEFLISYMRMPNFVLEKLAISLLTMTRFSPKRTSGDLRLQHLHKDPCLPRSMFTGNVKKLIQSTCKVRLKVLYFVVFN